MLTQSYTVARYIELYKQMNRLTADDDDVRTVVKHDSKEAEGKCQCERKRERR